MRTDELRVRGQSGHALLTTMIAAACLIPLGAFAAMQARLDFLVGHSTRTALETFVVADSGLEHALADLTADARFDRLLAGPDRQPGNGDDGEYPFALPPPAWFPSAPFRYDVRVIVQGLDALEIVARGLGPFNATRVVAATVVRDAAPYVPAALAIAARDAALALGPAFRIAGVDPSPADAGLPAVAVDGADAAAALISRLPSGGAGQLVGRGGAPSVAGVSPPSAEALADVAQRRVEAHALAGDVSGALDDGLFVSPGPLRLIDASISGVLVVAGTLELAGATSVSGLVVALGDVRLDPAGTATIDGAVQVGRAGAVVSLRGGGHIAYDPIVIARVDAAFPGLLPRRARITGWRQYPDAAL